MARYTCSYTLSVPLPSLPEYLQEVLESCNFSIIYQTTDYLMGRERPGRVAFSQLVTVEVLIDKTTATQDAVRVNFVIKNEELPLQTENHCQQVFENVRKSVSECHSWRLVEVVG